MEVNPKEAQESLRTIEQARLIAERHSQNNGVVQLVWGVVVLICLIGFDVFPRLAALFVSHTATAIAIGAIIAGIFTGLVAGCTAAWTGLYAKRLPVHPLKVENPMFFLWWGIYYVIVLFLGIFVGAFFFAGKAGFPPFWFTGIGIICAAPLLIAGWRMWQRSHALEG